jgi:hypothetical protein
MDLTEQPECAEHDASDPAERPNYFRGKLLGVDDLSHEQDYHRSKRRLHNRLLHGWGVVAGLEVTAGETASLVVVSPGCALDPCGNDILVPEPVVVDVSPSLPPGAGADQAVHLAIRYAETPSSPVPSPKGEEQFDRIVEGFEVGLLSRLPDAYQDMASSDLADIAGCSAARARPFPPPAGDPWVILADLMVREDDSIAGIDPLAHRRFVAAFGEFSFTCGGAGA